ncbi:MAG: sugar lactone lactonase YvrE [Bacteriovoracaceae bacterium]|jgi:sugar lactone lactonase YvrE
MFFKSILISFFISNFCIAATLQWETTQGISNPESVLYDQVNKVLYVSNIDGAGDKKDGKGHISILSESGNVLKEKWIKGLNAPKGMRKRGNLLWVTDIDEVIKISVEESKILRRIKFKGAKFLNDIAIDSNGEVYVSDTIANKIYIISNNKPSIFAEGNKYDSPNGLLVSNGLLYVASWGLTKDWTTKVPGKLYSISLDDREIKQITKIPLGNLDGLELDKSGNFIVSDWVAGKIFKISPKGKVETLYTGKKGLADIGINPETGLIFAPMMQDSKILGIK